MRKVLFATTNEGKLCEASSILDLKVEAVGQEIDEIQSLDEVKVAIKKAQDYFDIIKKPIIVEDIGLTFNFFNGLPGTYISDFLRALGNDGLTALIPKGEDRSATAKTAVVFCWGKNNYRVFKGKVEGTISSRPRGNKGFGWDPIFIPRGETRTFGQMSEEEKNKYSMRAKAVKKLKKWLDSEYAKF